MSDHLFLGQLLCLASLSLCSVACSTLFPTKAGESLAYFAEMAPQVGEMAPNFVLNDLEGNNRELSQLVSKRPVVIQLGSYTCPVFRYRRFDMHPLRAKYQDQVTFLVIYTQEAHPVGTPSPYKKGKQETPEEWVPWINRLARIGTEQATSIQDRTIQAFAAQQTMHSNAVFVVDDLDNQVWQQYGQAPSAAFLIDTNGRIVLRQPWINPKPLEQAIDELLAN